MRPPEAKSRPIDGVIARFETSVGTRLLAQIETPGGPADDLVGEWVVLDSTRTEVARGRRALSPSACEPTEAQVAEFASEVPPGNYLVGLSVRDPSGARGLQRVRVNVPEPGPALAISDIVVVCGLPPAGLSNVQLNANPSARVEGPDPLTAYFEVSHLVTGQDGRARFEYEYVVKSALRDPRVWLQRLFAPRREPPPVSATRRDEQAGGLRRQFVSVPVQSLPAGRYRLEITVRDLNGGGEIRGSAEFERANARGRESGARSPEGESRPKSG
jgi:hypothetical protein